jgi:hypothetical protein
MDQQSEKAGRHQLGSGVGAQRTTRDALVRQGTQLEPALDSAKDKLV